MGKRRIRSSRLFSPVSRRECALASEGLTRAETREGP